MKAVMKDLLNLASLEAALLDYGKEGPIDHCTVDNFFLDDVAEKLEAEFPSYNDSVWHEYDNAIEEKKVCNNWNLFPSITYSVFSMFNSTEFTSLLSKQALADKELFSDPGLNGGGWHIHAKGGKLNSHLDYSLHPKLGLQRKLNIIVYLNAKWREEWGGHLGMWGNESSSEPGKLAKAVVPRFNRAVLFDTTQNSWHGLSNPIECPDGEYRKSLAVYFLCEPPENADARGKALFAPTDEQKSNPDVLELIKKRSDIKTAADVYKKS